MNRRVLWSTVFFAAINSSLSVLSNNINSTNIDFSQTIDVAVIGSGPAGCAAALQCAHLGLQTKIFTGDLLGGLLSETNFVDNWAGMKRIPGAQLMEEQLEQTKKAGAHVSETSIIKIDCSVYPFTLITSEQQIVRALAVIIATGSSPRLLNIAGEKEFWGNGVSACAVCDAPMFEDKTVIVVGGGDSAVEQATHLASFAKNVTIVVRKDSLRACQHMQEKINLHPNIGVIFNTEIVKINGNQGHVTSVLLQNNKNQQNSNLKIDGIFLALGHIPNTQIFAEQLELNHDGTGKLLGRSQCSSKPGIFFAGDVADGKYRQAACASGSGCAAALDARDFLYEHGLTPALLKKHRTTPAR